MDILVKTTTGSYPIILQRGALNNIGKYFSLDRKVMIVTDTGVPKEYAETVEKNCKKPIIHTIPQGEESKQIETYTSLLKTLVENEFTRTDCIVAVGGGVVGDISGFVASTYMRGIDFYGVPTTVLSQVDSSIGGKTAIDFMGLKNIVGAFYPPKGVLIDSDTLKTLPKRQISNGLAEAVKMSLTCDEKLFNIFETADLQDEKVIDTIIYKSLLIKKYVVEQDEKESGLRKVLNFGHTLAHAIESLYDMKTYYHGECVAIGMLPMCANDVRERLLPVLKKLDLPTQMPKDIDALLMACRHDKKADGDAITFISVPKVGTYEMKTVSFDTFEKQIRQVTVQ